MTRREFLRLLAASTLAGGALRPASAQVPRRPNILFILMDDMGWMDSTVYGSRYYETPSLQRLARRSVVFTQAYAASPFCSPTRASLLTGKYPARLGFTTPAGHLPPLPEDRSPYAETAPPWQRVICPESRRYLPLEERTLAEVLRDHGYHTGFIGKWHLGQPEQYWPTAQGFEVNIGGGGYPGPPSYFSPYRIKPLPDGPPGEYLPDRLTDETLRYLREPRDRPFLLCLWHYSVHAPFQAKEELTARYAGRVDPRGKQDNPIMAAMLQSADESLGRVLDYLDASGLSDDTIVIFFSDNGGNEYDRVGDKQWLPTNNDPLRSGKGSLYEGGTRVPMMVCWPGVTKPGSQCDAVVSSVDFYPTILEMLSLQPEPDTLLDGESLVPVLRGTGGLHREAIFCHFPHVSQAKSGLITMPGTWVRRGDWKLIRFYDTCEQFPARRELYNLRDDLEETRNLAAQYPLRVQELDSLIDGFLRQTGALVPRPNPAYDAAALSQVDGWRPSGQTILSRGEGTLKLRSLGNDPFIMQADVPAGSGALLVTFRLKSDSQGPGQFFWADAQTPQFGPSVRLNFQPRHDGQWHEYEVPFSTNGALRQIRIDPCTAPGMVELDWVRLRKPDGTLLKGWEF